MIGTLEHFLHLHGSLFFLTDQNKSIELANITTCYTCAEYNWLKDSDHMS